MRKAVIRAGVGFAVAFSVSGCALPVTVAAAGYALSGFTLVDQGKTVSDVVLSAALDEDCALWRIIQDQPVCIDIPDDGTVYAELDEPALGQVADITGKAPKATSSN